MASTSTTFSLSSSTLIDAKAPRQQSHCVTLPVMPQNRFQKRDSRKSIYYCRRVAPNVIPMATGETQFVATTEAPVAPVPTSEAPAEDTTEFPEIVKTIQTAWDKVEDKYAVTSLAVVGVVVLWGSTGLISAIDRLPLVPGVLELVGIGYTGWFVYQNLVFKPDREELINKVKDTYDDVIGSN